MIIKYEIKFKRILIVAAQDKGKMVQMRVGEVTNFIQNADGSLNIIGWIWPQTPKQIQDNILKNPSIMGMTAETLPVDGALSFPDGTIFEDKDDETQLDECRARIEYLEKRLAQICDDMGQNL